MTLSEIGDKIAAVFSSNEKILSAVEKQTQAESQLASATEALLQAEKDRDNAKTECALLSDALKKEQAEIVSLKDQLKAAQDALQTEPAKAVAKALSELAIPPVKDNTKADAPGATVELKGFNRILEATRAELEKINK